MGKKKIIFFWWRRKIIFFWVEKKNYFLFLTNCLDGAINILVYLIVEHAPPGRCGQIGQANEDRLPADIVHRSGHVLWSASWRRLPSATCPSLSASPALREDHRRSARRSLRLADALLHRAPRPASAHPPSCSASRLRGALRTLRHRNAHGGASPFAMLSHTSLVAGWRREHNEHAVLSRSPCNITTLSSGKPTRRSKPSMFCVYARSSFPFLFSHRMNLCARVGRASRTVSAISAAKRRNAAGSCRCASNSSRPAR